MRARRGVRGAGPDCVPRTAHRLTVVDGVRFYRGAGADWYACRGRRGVRTRLTSIGPYAVLSGPRALAVRGNRVAFAFNLYDDGPDFGEVAFTYVGSTRLGTNTPRNTSPGDPTALGPNGERNTPQQQYNGGAVGSLVIVPDGRRAWITCPSGSRYDRCVEGMREVYVSEPLASSALPRRLAAGPRIDSRSLRVSADGAAVSWVENGATRTASLA